MKIAALQTVSTPDVGRNLAAAERLVARAAEAGATLAALPEYFCLMGRHDRDKLDAAEPAVAAGEMPTDRSPIQSALSAAARRHGLWLIGGTVPVRPGAAASAHDRVLNRVPVFAPDGTLAGHYDKMHLFRYDNGREQYDEARVLAAGDRPVALDLAGLRVGLSVCYDLRFPELYRALTATPCDLLVVPAAFTYTTGLAHWELLLRARAVENQCYVLAAAQGGHHENGRRTFGHSLVVDPWGEVLAVQAEGEGVVMAELDRDRLAAVRRQLPALEHRRMG
jgi:nitrilase